MKPKTPSPRELDFQTAREQAWNGRLICRRVWPITVWVESSKTDGLIRYTDGLANYYRPTKQDQQAKDWMVV